MYGLRVQNNRVYRGLESETPEELRSRLRRIRQTIKIKCGELRLVKENPLLHCIIYQYESEIRASFRARNKIKKHLNAIDL